MDILTFNALLPLANKVVYRDKIEDANIQFTVTNGAFAGKRENLDKMTKGILKDIGASPEEQIKKGTRGAADFLRDFKLGAKGGKL